MLLPIHVEHLILMNLMLLYNAANVVGDLQATWDQKIGEMLKKKSHNQKNHNQKQIYV